MITDLFLTALMDVLQFLLQNILTQPDVTTNNNFTTSIVTAATYYLAFDAVLHYTLLSLYAIIAFDLIFEGSYLLFKLIRFGYRKIPGIT